MTLEFMVTHFSIEVMSDINGLYVSDELYYETMQEFLV